jgi:nucleoside transporter
MNSVKFKLSMMMFLQFFIWGAWFPLVFGYLPAIGFTDLQQSIVLSTFNVAALAAIFGTQFVDRYFAAEKFLALSMLIGGLAMIGLGMTKDFYVFLILMLVHCVFYVPSISIANAIAFANVKDAKNDFGIIRLWGTIGWIAASWPFIFILVDWAAVDAKLAANNQTGFIAWLGTALGTGKTGPALIDATRYTFLTAGIASLVLAAFSLLLPHTPPKKTTGETNLAIVEALSFLKYPYILILFIVTFIDAAVHQCYFIYTGRFLEHVGIPSNWVMPAMSIGQFAEIFTMAILGYFLKSLGWKWTMVIGILGHALRFGVFAYMPSPWAALAVILVHGICYAFFFATVYIFVDEYFPKDVRASAQGLFNVLILGVGPLFSNFAGPALMSYYTADGAVSFMKVFQIPMLGAIIGAALLAFLFNPPLKAEKNLPTGMAGEGESPPEPVV